MIVVKLYGGLGNQMFQYAFGRYLSHKNKTKLVLDINSFDMQKLRKYELNIFNFKTFFLTNTQRNTFFLPPHASFLNKAIYRLSKFFYNNIVVIEPRFSFSYDLLNISPRAYLEGYFQSEKYFIEIKEIIKKDFTFHSPLNIDNKNMLNIIKNTNSVSLHIRRGDYVLNPNTNRIHGICDIDYYFKSTEYMCSNTENPIFFIFSDDMNWVKQNIKIKAEHYYVDFNNSQNDFEDMRLMSFCKHNIIANSSFSWWGAWLNDNRNKIVIAPKKWFNDSSKDTTDLIPSSWIRI